MAQGPPPHAGGGPGADLSHAAREAPQATRRGGATVACAARSWEPHTTGWIPANRWRSLSAPLS